MENKRGVDRYDGSCKSNCPSSLLVNNPLSESRKKGVENVTELKQYTNAAEVDAEKIPQSTINRLADMFYEVFARSLQEQETEQQTA